MHVYPLQNVNCLIIVISNAYTTLGGQEINFTEQQISTPLGHMLITTNAINVTMVMHVICQNAVTKLEQG